MKSFLKLAVTGVCLCGLLCREASAQEADPAPPQESVTQLTQEQLPLNTLIVGDAAGWKVELAPTLSAFTGDGLRLSALAWSNPFGVEVAAVDEALRSQLSIAEGTGVVVTSVADESEAAKAGLKPHDVVLQINDQPVASPEKFNETVANEQGHEVKLGLMRQGQPLSITVTLPRKTQYELQVSSQLQAASALSESLRQYRIGVTLSEADDTLRSQLRLAAGEGLVVTEVISDGPAAGAGIRPHDVLIKLDGKRLSTVESINAQIQEIGERPVALDYIRAGDERTCDVTPQFSQEAALTRIKLWNVRDGQSASSRLLRSVRHGNDAELAIRWLQGVKTGDHDAAESVPGTDAAGQIEELKRKLADIAQSLDALDAALQPPRQEQKAAEEPQPEESKPE
jgi:membrane-associated protease RseP (regulator of RpoE activity)